jgi:hypothetical protein
MDMEVCIQAQYMIQPLHQSLVHELSNSQVQQAGCLLHFKRKSMKFLAIQSGKEDLY